MAMKLFIALIVIVSGSAYAGTDTTCVNDCMKLNNPKAFCVSECSYSDNTEPLRAKPRAPAPKDQADYLMVPDPQAPKRQATKNLADNPQAPKGKPSANQCMETCKDEGSTPQFCQRLCAKLGKHEEENDGDEDDR
jgi:hypothetical protein